MKLFDLVFLFIALVFSSVHGISRHIRVVEKKEHLTSNSSTKSFKTYKYRSYGEIVNYILELKRQYPNYVKVFTAQEQYGLPTPSELMCHRNGKLEYCKQYILHITNLKTLNPLRPEIFFSGALHGNERVGPNAVTELAAFLLDHASRKNGNKWIKHLVNTRSIVLMPTTNAYGYDRNERGERYIDPNRDYNYLAAPKCMETMTSRSVNELWRSHIFQLAITFHGGMRAVSYEWGSTNHYQWGRKSEKSPDDRAQWFMSVAMSRFGGKFSNNQYYPYGIMNDIVYGVRGGMEDWAYAASWENDVTPNGKEKPISPCRPKNYGGYSSLKTIYNKATHRAFNILIETSNSKYPSESSLGTSESLSDDKLENYLPESSTVGHIARNIRLSLLYIDLLEPYINWILKGQNTGTTKFFSWEVMGAITVDKTYLKYSTSSTFETYQTTKFQTGGTRWMHLDHKVNKERNKIFSEKISFPTSSSTIYVQVVAIVDQNWKQQGSGNDKPAPFVKPQSHIVNARTNPSWNYESNGHRVTGRLNWLSKVITIQV